MVEPRTVVIVNPRSQGGATGKRWPETAERLRRHFGFEDLITESPGDATRLARRALERGAERVVAVGGDGTINEVVNGFFDGTRPVSEFAALAIVPLGTGGDFRRTAGIPHDLDAAARVVAGDHRRRIDLGHLRYTTAAGTPAERIFVNITSFGVSGVVDRLVNQSKKRLGRLSYALASARATLGFTNPRVHLRFDDDPGHTADLTINTVAVANGQYFGGAMHIAPDAALDDGFFDVVALGDISAARAILSARRLYAGTHLSMANVSSRRARIVDAEAVDAGTAIELDLDGENVGRLPARFTMLAGALPLVVPAP